MKRDKFTSVMYACIAILLVGIIALAVVGISFKLGALNPDSGGTTQEQPDTDSPDNPDERYWISILARLDNKYVVVSEYLECNIATAATAGETVAFTAKSKLDNFVIECVTYDSGKFLAERNDAYSFVMPEYDVTICIYLVESSVSLYRITWDLDRTSSITLDINEIECSLPERAKAGDIFDFTITVKNPAYTVREAVLVGGDDSGFLTKSANTGVFFLRMPAADVSILIYVDEVEL